MHVSLYVTAPSKREARRIAKALLDARLVACANIFPIESHYWWKGNLESARETAIIMKTTRRLAKRAIAEVKRLHSYDVPCVVAWKIVEGNADYLDWIEAETRGNPRHVPGRTKRARR